MFNRPPEKGGLFFEFYPHDQIALDFNTPLSNDSRDQPLFRMNAKTYMMKKLLIFILMTFLLLGLFLFFSSNTSTPKPLKVSSPPASTTSPPEPARVPVAQPIPTPAPAPTPDADELQVDPNLEEIDLDDPYFLLLASGQADLASRLKTSTVLQVYETSDEATRLDLVAFLSDTNQLEDYLIDLLKIEQDSSLRTWMFSNYTPKSAFEFYEVGEEPKDLTLLKALDVPMNTPISAEEYVERIRTVSQADDDATLAQIEKALKDWPNDPHLQYVTAESLVRTNQRAGNVSAEKVNNAYKIIKKALDVPADQSELSTTERIRGFFALATWGTNEERREFYKEQLTLETDPTALDILTNLYDQASAP